MSQSNARPLISSGKHIKEFDSFHIMHQNWSDNVLVVVTCFDVQRLLEYLAKFCWRLCLLVPECGCNEFWQSAKWSIWIKSDLPFSLYTLPKIYQSELSQHRFTVSWYTLPNIYSKALNMPNIMSCEPNQIHLPNKLQSNPFIIYYAFNYLSRKL